LLDKTMMDGNNDQGFDYLFNILRAEKRGDESIFKLIQEVTVCKAAIGVVSQARNLKATVEENLLDAYESIVGLELDNGLWKGLLTKEFTLDKMKDSHWKEVRHSRFSAEQKKKREEKKIAFVKMNEDLKSKGRRENVEGKLSADKVWKMRDAINSVINNDFAEELSKHVYKSKNNQLLSGKQFIDTVDLMRRNMFLASIYQCLFRCMNIYK
jgi:hypothetical protein